VPDASGSLADVLAQVDDWPVDTPVTGVTDATRTLATHGAADAVHPLASVTKPLTAYAVLIAVQDGLVHLDEPAGPEGSTIRHLLAHASGVPFSEGGPSSPPGERRVYSNLGYELLAEVVERRVGQPFAQFLDLEVCQPLHLDDIELSGSAAADAVGSVRDLLAFGRELLDPQLLDADLHRQATTIAFPGLDGVLPGHGRQRPNDWGLGFELKDGKEPHWTGRRLSPATFGHFGQSGSFLWVDPELGAAGAFLADRRYGGWAESRWPPFIDAVADVLRS
jgi:CubicO group peptidase (beta-lactamase class C family)